jgi:hypothetical protein
MSLAGEVPRLALLIGTDLFLEDVPPSRTRKVTGDIGHPVVESIAIEMVLPALLRDPPHAGVVGAP